jgi:hypothetical protein
MGAQGTAVIDFGSWPGKTDTSVVISGQAGIVSGSLIEAWLLPTDTGTLGTDTFHSHDEHLVARLKITAGSIVAGTGFTVYAFSIDNAVEPLVPTKGVTGTLAGGLSAPQLTQQPTAGGQGARFQGTFTIAWVWS